MATFKNRGEQVCQTEGVRLRAKFKDSSGTLADLDAFPTITITQPSGSVLLGPTSAGVYRLSTGVYGYDFLTGYNQSLGIYTDTWDGILSGFPVSGSFSFVLVNGQIPSASSDGYMTLGQDVPYCYSQKAILTINKLLMLVKARLNSRGLKVGKDSFGNNKFSQCDIFSVDIIVANLIASLSHFNAMPHFTNFTFDDDAIGTTFLDVIAQGAVINLLAGQALLERGSEYSVSESALTFSVSTLSELLNSQWSAEVTAHTARVTAIKATMKPAALGLGTLTIGSGSNPAVASLRFRKARRIF